ncbi:MAG: tRNA 2-thiouridine(34) synthase MnmA [Oscillospiraceae bacterium]|nr:tRNA 2-thiouridine(34) synthase MnmA [Oscillospiraceae bacterium]
MSGGVDSSVAAWLMQQQGYACEGVNLQLYRNTDIGLACHKSCCTAEDQADAADAAFRLGMPFEVLDYQGLFRELVMEDFVRSYEAGRTPNPCIQCNRYMKFDYLLDYALDQGFDCLVSGHYARNEWNEDTGRWELKKALDESKDQTYVLYMLTQRQLSHLCFPLGHYRKTEIRRIAAELGLVTAAKPDSQDICFVPDGDYTAFLERYTGKRYPAGDFLDLTGKKLGQHRGAVRYTVGQRRGLELPMGSRVYVASKDMESNTVTVGPESALYSDSLIAAGMNWISIPELTEPLRVTAKTRYRQAEQAATAYPVNGGRMRLIFDQPQRAVTPGQAVVLYDGERVVGGGTIQSAEKKKKAVDKGGAQC